MVVNAQEEHMTFMGIPIDGKIQDFQSEMKNKGFKRDGEGQGCKYMKGYFDNKEARIFIFYDSNSKIVYSVSVQIPCGNESKALNHYNYFKDALHEKYIEYGNSIFRIYGDSIKSLLSQKPLKGYDEIEKKDALSGYNSYTIEVRKFSNESLDYIGDISLFIFQIEVPWHYRDELQKQRYNIGIKYSDTKNSLKYNSYVKLPWESDL